MKDERIRIYDARGKGEGGVSPTITGDHENRVTDYTSVVIIDHSRRHDYQELEVIPTLEARMGTGGGQYPNGADDNRRNEQQLPVSFGRCFSDGDRKGRHWGGNTPIVLLSSRTQDGDGGTRDVLPRQSERQPEETV